MRAESPNHLDERILIFAPTGRDSALTARFLVDANLRPEACESVEHLCHEMNDGAGLVFLTGEALTLEAMQCLTGALAEQPPWSDIPVVVLTSGGGGTPANAATLSALSEAGNVTLIERPVRVMTLMSAVKSALRARRHQYDVRERLEAERRAKEALAQSEQQLRTLANAIPPLAWMAEPDGHIFWYNQRWYDYTGATPEQMEGWGWQSVHDPGMLPQVLERWRDSINTGEPFEMEFPLKGADGSFRSFLTRVIPLKDEQGRVLRWFGTNTDVEELRRALLEAEDANRTKDEFLATLSHELRTPLTSILGWARMLSSGQLDAATTARALETIERNAKAQSQLIEDILDVSRVITGKLRLDAQPVNLASVIESAINAVLPAADAKGIRLQRLLDTGVSMVSGDPARLQQIIWNLLSNAIKFTPKDGRVRVKLEHAGSHVEITVTDNGQGISPDILPYIFERFRQADSSTTRAHGGLGLGLAIVRHLVEMHGGTVRAESRGEGQGATFTINLPLVVMRAFDVWRASDVERAHPTARADIPFDCPSELDGLRLLVVDDEADTRTLLKAVLEKCGASVITVASAGEALAALKETRPDVMISDLGMPGEDGYTLIKKVRALSAEDGGQTPSAALTAYARVEDRMKVLRAGFQIHIPKPIEPAELIAVVANLAGRTAV
ncbi:MAG: ATP-binding protein [Pyrinomonadaceae bacterium]